MSTAERPIRTAVPPLVEGQRIDQAEFHRRYEAMPPETRAELIDGVVFMPGPVGPEHGRAQVPALVWLNYYEENTPRVEVLDNTSTALGSRSEPQPDAQLRILPECGGRTETDRRVVRGVPELLVEVSHTTRYHLTLVRSSTTMSAATPGRTGEYIVRAARRPGLKCSGMYCTRAGWSPCPPMPTACFARVSSRACGSILRRF